MLCVAIVSLAARARAQNSAVTIDIDAAADRHPISPFIYGLNYAGARLGDLNAPLHRLGGNNLTRYNWKINADNRAGDWYFQSIGDASGAAARRVDDFVAANRATGAESIVTIPLIGWVAKLGTERGKLSSYSIAKYGVQTDSDWQWFPDAGNGVRWDGSRIHNNDPNDANVPSNAPFQQGLVEHLVGAWGAASQGGVRFYTMDNEPSIWHVTHRDVHPTGATMEEVRDRILAYAAMVKAVDPTALILGPEEWGWLGYLYSGYDQQYASKNGWANPPDRAAHGGWDYVPWLLDQMRQHEAASGQRLLDVLSLHYYPQGGEFSNDYSTGMQQRRNRSTRSLWDPNYKDESWINSVVRLIPRMKEWVATYYPGTLTAITEYNWGAENHINGATAQADLLGIFGREGLDMATRWTTPAAAAPTYKAIKMYRDYDGKKSTFGDISVRAVAPNPDRLSAFAAERSGDGALTVMVVSKVLSGETPITLNIANFAADGVAEVWQLTSFNAIQRLADIPFGGSSLSAAVPPQSITLFVLPALVSAPHTLLLEPAGLVGGDSTTGRVMLSSPAPPGGLTIALASSDPTTAQVPDSVTIPGGETMAAFPIFTAAVPSTARPVLSAIYNGVTRTATLTLWPSPLASVSVSPVSVVGGNFANALLLLNTPAPAGGAVVALASDDPAVIVPASVTVPEGARAAAFTVNTTPIAANNSATISASYAGATQTTALTVRAAAFSLIKLNPPRVLGGLNCSGRAFLSGPAPAGGVVITLKSSNAVATVPESVTIPEGEISAPFPITTAPVTAPVAVLIKGHKNGNVRAATLIVKPPSLSLSLKPSKIAGGASSTGKVTLALPAPSGGAVVTLESGDPLATVPASVIVAEGAQTAHFKITTGAVTETIPVVISATYDGYTDAATLTLRPAALASLQLDPAKIVGGKSSVGKVTLDGLAPTGGILVSLSSANPAIAEVPASVTIPAGASSATFKIKTTPVTDDTPVVLAASYKGVTKKATLTVKSPALSALRLNPYRVVGGASSTGKVVLTGPAPQGGVTIALSSANPSVAEAQGSVTVPPGATTATFPVTTRPVTSSTQVALFASYRGVTKRATLTVNP